MSVGRVKWFNSEKGYGFLETAECQQDVFVHFSDIEMEGYKSLQENAVVRFSLQPGEKGPCAKQVRPMDWIDDRWQTAVPEAPADTQLEPQIEEISHLWRTPPAPNTIQRQG